MSTMVQLKPNLPPPPLPPLPPPPPPFLPVDYHYVYGTLEVSWMRDFQSFVYSLSLHIIAITETWLSPSIFDGDILSTGFTLYHKDRKTHGGGVLLAIHHSLPFLQLQSPPDLEVVTVQIMTRGTPLICIVYIPPNSDNNYCLAIVDYLNSISANHQILILGDFNSPDICWSTLTGHSSSLELFVTSYFVITFHNWLIFQLMSVVAHLILL